jgi:hypothetical protein
MAVEVEGAAFMAAEGVVSTAEAAEARTPVVEAGPGGDLTRLRLPATEVHALRPRMLRDPAVGTPLGPAIVILLGPAETLRAGISGMEIPPRRPLLSPADNGILLAARLGVVDHRARNREAGLQRMPAASTYLTETAEQDLQVRSAAFRAKAVKSMRMLLWPEMLFPDRNRSRRCTIRSTAHSLQVPRFGQTRTSRPLRVSQAVLRSRATEGFQVA